MSEVDRDELVAQIRTQAMSVLMFTYSDPQLELPEPKDMNDLGSFAVVQLVLLLEDTYDVLLMEDMPSFAGSSFEDLADFVAVRIEAGRKAQEVEEAGA